MRVLAIHRYYWPDTPPYASLLRSIVQEWRSAGHEVDVLTSQPSYKPEAAVEKRPPVDEVDGVRVRRIDLAPDRTSARHRIINQVMFPVLAAWRLLAGRRYDVVMCSTVPPVLLGVAVSIAARLRRSRFVYHCMDLHPEIGALSGEFAHPLMRRVLARLELGTCRRAARIIVLSEDMRNAVLARDASLTPRVEVLTNFELPDYEEADAASPLPPGDRVRVVFAGNLGRFQGLETMTAAMLGADHALDRVELVLMGEGAAKAELERMVAATPVERRDRVRLLAHGTPAQARALLRTADLGLVSLTPEVIRYAFPSKTATYLSEGVPVLARVEADSELARLVEREGVGRHLGGGVEECRRALLELAEDTDELFAMRDRARELWKREYAADQLLPRWRALLNDVSLQGAA